MASRLWPVAHVWVKRVDCLVHVTSYSKHCSLSCLRSTRRFDVVLHILLHRCDHSPYGGVLGASRGDGQPEGVDDGTIQEVRDAPLESHTMDSGRGDLDP